MDIQQKIKEELKRVIIELGGEVEDKEIVLSLPIQESMEIMPPIWR